jgi:hypothetical protein
MAALQVVEEDGIFQQSAVSDQQSAKGGKLKANS